MVTKTEQIDGLDGQEQEMEVTEAGVEMVREVGRSKEDLVKIFDLNEIERIIDNAAAQLSVLREQIKDLEEKGLGGSDESSALIILKELRFQKLEDWSDIRDLIRKGNFDTEQIDAKVENIKMLAKAIKVQNENLEAIEAKK